jgi:single-strand DNA-binding protein
MMVGKIMAGPGLAFLGVTVGGAVLSQVLFQSATAFVPSRSFGVTTEIMCGRRFHQAIDVVSFAGSTRSTDNTKFKSSGRDIFDIFDDDSDNDEPTDLINTPTPSSSPTIKSSPMKSSTVPPSPTPLPPQPMSDDMDTDVDDSEFEDHIPQLNIVNLVGRTTWTPEPRYFDDGKVVVNVGLAVTRKYHPLERRVKNIKYGQEETDYFTLEVWGRDAEFMAKYISKGARIGVSGSLVIDQYLSKATNELVTKPKVLVKEFDVLESKAEADRRKQNSSGGGAYYSGNNSGGGGGGGGYNSNKYSSGNKTPASDSYGMDDQDSPSSAGSGGFFD